MVVGLIFSKIWMKKLPGKKEHEIYQKRKDKKKHEYIIAKVEYI